MSKYSVQILVFSIVFAIFLLAPGFLSAQFGPYPLMKWGDVLDLLTPLVLLPLYWLLFVNCCDEPPSQRETLVFIALAGVWAMGHGMHLVANSIGHLLAKGGDVYTLTYFYDEVLSHYLWHLGIVGLAVLLLARAWRCPYKGDAGYAWPVILAGIIHGLTLFIIFIEGGTAPLGIAFSLIVALVVLIWGRDKLKNQPLIGFIFISCLVALLFFAGWGIYWGGLPQFSELGII